MRNRLFSWGTNIICGLNLQTSRHLAEKRSNKHYKSILLMCFNKHRILERKIFFTLFSSFCIRVKPTVKPELASRSQTINVYVSCENAWHFLWIHSRHVPEIKAYPVPCSNLATLRATTLFLDHGGNVSEWCACRTRNPVACVASVSRAKNARNIFAFAPFFAREKRQKPRFFALCSTETLATQASNPAVPVPLWPLPGLFPGTPG